MGILGWIIVIGGVFLSSYNDITMAESIIYSVTVICGTAMIIADRIWPLRKPKD